MKNYFLIVGEKIKKRNIIMFIKNRIKMTRTKQMDMNYIWFGLV